MPPAADIACKILEFPDNVYIPGFCAFPETKIFTSLISDKAYKCFSTNKC